jgi:hypothetical protein
MVLQNVAIDTDRMASHMARVRAIVSRVTGILMRGPLTVAAAP